MSDKPISVGDLVVIVRWPCCGYFLGRVYTVYGFANREPRGCVQCGVRMPSEKLLDAGYNSASQTGHGLAPLSWFKRIPPLSELEGQRTQEDIKEPA